MSLLNIFKSSASKKGEQIADYVISLGANKDFQKLLYSTSKPMSIRLLFDYLLVCFGAATYLLFLKYTGRPDDAKQAYESMIKRQVYHLENTLKAAMNFNIGDIIVDESEKVLFLKEGWKLNEFTTVRDIFAVIGDYRMDKYSRAVGEGLAEFAQNKSEGARITAKLMQASKKSCGGLGGFPYAELKLIYTNCIFSIMKAVNDKKE